MSVLYLLTAPAPPIAGTDAVRNEVAALRAAVGGETINLFPFARPTLRCPRSLYGLHAIPALRRAEARNRLNHIYFPILHWFPIMGLLRNPMIYTVAATLDRARPPRNLAKLRTLARIIVSNERDAATLEAWKISNFAIVAPGIDTSTISRRSLPLAEEVILLMASAPWHRQHFDLKGIDVLLQAATKVPHLKLMLVWRGLLLDVLTERIARYGLQGRIVVVNEHVDIGAELARVHAAVLLAKEGYVVKAYPHSLLESLVAGKPVIVSNQIAMADYVARHRCGIVVDEVTVPAIIDAVDALKSGYGELQRGVERLPPGAFSLDQLIDTQRQIYACARAHGGDGHATGAGSTKSSSSMRRR